MFAAAVASAVWTGYQQRQGRLGRRLEPQPVRLQPLSLDWSRELFQTWKLEEDGISLEYPARFDVVRGFGKFTARWVAGGIREEDVAAFRSMAPRSVITIALYRAPRQMTWAEWKALALRDRGAPPARDPKAPAPFAAELGGSDFEDREVQLGEFPALAVRARGAVKYPIRGSETLELWQFDSRLVAQGDRAVRVTAGVHLEQAALARPGLDRVLNSFRWRSGRPGE
ncbi:MAG: hypothetical protein FJX77_02345 [Armatimonadetes bacterium]|nr:hypothetical protein [Armatimonadota bacterium]